MRLVHASVVLKWRVLKVYETLETREYLSIPYAQTNDALWSRCCVLSWRHSKPKVPELDRSFCPMSNEQLQQLQAFVQSKSGAIDYVWVDWSCVPQYSDPSSMMTEILRSKLFYSRAAYMCLVPTMKSLESGGIVVALLRSVLRELEDRAAQNGGENEDAPAFAAAQALTCILEDKLVADKGYFGRVCE